MRRALAVTLAACLVAGTSAFGGPRVARPVGLRASHTAAAPSAAPLAGVQRRRAAASGRQASAVMVLPQLSSMLASAFATPRAAAVAVSVAAALLGFAAWLVRSLTTPARTYKSGEDFNSVQEEYNAWSSEGILEYYWGEHIHLGYYNDAERAAGYKKKDFIQAKYDFIDEMLKWSGADMPSVKTVLDVGCGIGGTSRYLAKKYPGAQVTGITISDVQVRRATELAAEQGVPNAKFELKDALKMDYPDNSFDMVWACESGEHMPDKKKYVEEMARVLKPGGTLVFATWCQRETPPDFTPAERDTLDFLYGEWTHPYFISIEEYTRLMDGSGLLERVDSDDWAKETIPSWRHSIWVGVWDPWIVVAKPHLWWKTLRDGVTLERMHRAFTSGLMRYGMLKAVKKQGPAPPPPPPPPPAATTAE